MKKTVQLSENIVLGCLIHNTEWMVNLTQLKVEHFSKDVNKVIYKSLNDFYIKGATSVTPIDLYAHIETDKSMMKILQNSDGVEYLHTLYEVGIDKSLEQCEVHSQNVITQAFKNDCFETLNVMINDVDGTKEKRIGAIYNNLEARLLGIRNKYSSGNSLVQIGEVLDKELSMLDNESRSSYSGFPTFSPTLNVFTTYERGECVVISGEKKTGKSQFVVNEVYRLCIEGNVPTIVLDSELSTRFFITRLLARITGYNIKYIKNGYYKQNPIATQKVALAVEKIRNAPLYHQFIVGMSESELTNEIKRVKLAKNVQLLFYDYIKADVTTNEDMQERLQLAHITNWLKNTVAGSMNIAVVALAQTAPNYDKNGTLRIFGSSQVNMYASSVLFLVKKNNEMIMRDYGKDVGGNYYIYIADNRNGMQFSDQSYGININFDTGTCTLYESQYQHESIKQLVNEQSCHYEGDGTNG